MKCSLRTYEDGDRQKTVSVIIMILFFFSRAIVSIIIISRYKTITSVAVEVLLRSRRFRRFLDNIYF